MFLGFFQKGFIKRPCVSEIICSTSSPDQTLSLGCEITDFYPPNINVTWLKLRDGEQDDREEEVIQGGEMWGPIQTQSRIYRATATLKRRATQKKEQGGGIICRVEHSSLLEPIEKHWRGIDIGMNHFLDVHLTIEKKKHANPLIFHSFTPSVCTPLVAPSIPPSISVCWSSEGVGVFSLMLKGGHPKAKLLWAAGGPTLSPLVSNETEEIGDDGQRELKSVCALETSTSLPSPTSNPQERQKNGHTISTCL